MIMKRFGLLALTIWLPYSLYAKPDSIASAISGFVQNINAFNQLYPQEKVYLHFDNTGYYLGETIWFKAYVVNADNLRSDSKSRVLYVELLSARGTLLETKKLKIENGQCHGEFYLQTLNHDYYAGFYEIRAYTKWMLNFGAETIFSRVFPVFNPPEKMGDYSSSNMEEGYDVKRLNLPTERKKPKKMKRVNFDFYPEGGNLIIGLSNRIVFKATNENGQGINVTGELQNAKGESVKSFSSLHNGMGAFEYIPDGSKNKVKVTYQGKNHYFELPKSILGGYCLKINSLLQNDLILQIEKSIDIPTVPLGLSIMCRGEGVFFRMLQVDAATFVLKIPKRELPVGVNQFTLFDAKGEVFAERLVFITPKQNEHFGPIKAIPNKEKYGTQERITINFSTDMPETTFSLSVRDSASTLSTADTGDIITNLLLSSDLKGHIENPLWYFEQDDAERRTALDLLMMVQGWKRYEWQQMAGINPFSRNYDLEARLKIKGKIVGVAKEVNIEVALDDENYLMNTVYTDDSSNFSIEVEDDLFGTYSMLLKAPGLKNAHMNIRLDRWFSPAPKIYSFYEINALHYLETIDTNDMAEPDNSLITTRKEKADSVYKWLEIQEIEVNSKRGKDVIYNVEKDRDKMIDTKGDYPETAHDYLIKKQIGSFYYQSDDPDQPWDNDRNVSGHWLWVYKKLCNGQYMINDSVKSGKLAPYEKTHFNGMEYIQKIVVREWQQYLQANSNFETYWVVPFYYYLYEYMDRKYYGFRKSPDYRVTKFDGYSVVKDFYQNTPLRENYVPDKSEYTRTLYWNPDVRTDKNGNAIVSFYNNAYCSKIDISAEGITKEGFIISNKK
jgi:hypothetical protein